MTGCPLHLTGVSAFNMPQTEHTALSPELPPSCIPMHRVAVVLLRLKILICDFFFYHCIWIQSLTTSYSVPRYLNPFFLVVLAPILVYALDIYHVGFLG